jgi:hypothetical protein
MKLQEWVDGPLEHFINFILQLLKIIVIENGVE